MLKELLYPFDAEYILRHKKALRRQLLEQGQERLKKKIAILGGGTTKDIRQVLDLFLLNQDIEAEFYESEYNQFYEDAVFGNEELNSFGPDLVYICTSNHNVSVYPHIKDTDEEIEEMLRTESDRYRQVWESLTERFHCPIIQNNFEMPYRRLLGNRDAYDIHGRVNYLTCLNLQFYRYAQEHDAFHICDINYLSADYGLSKWSDPSYYHMYKYAMHINAIPILAFSLSNIIKSIYGKNKKAFALDLDNTLWGGVIGDDGVDGIVLGEDTPEGQIFTEFQEYIKEHTELGILLTVDSKNEEENALAGLNHPDSRIRPDDCVALRANWETKDRNLRGIAEELSLLPESFLFVDDNPAERKIIEDQIPGVVAPVIGDPCDYIRILDRGGYFEVTSFSEEDRKRGEMYLQNRQRSQMESKYENYTEYLQALEMQATIKAFDPIHFARIAQLTNKSNQFNLTTLRCTPNEIAEMASNPGYITVYGDLKDRYGDNGIVSVAAGEILDGVCHIRLWLMSCRVLKREMEYAMMDCLVRAAKTKGVRSLRGYYYPTAKNRMVKDFYLLQGFTKETEDAEGNTEWVYEIPEAYECKNHVIKVDE